MTETELKQLLFEGLYQIAPEIDFSDLRFDDNLREELDIDSFDFLNFLIGINEKIGIEIPEQDYEKLMSLEQIINYLMKRIQVET